jgi:hypothetical protein
MARRLFGFSVLWCQAGEVPKTSEQLSLSLSLCVCTPLFLYNFVLSPSLNDGVCEGNTVFFYTII